MRKGLILLVIIGASTVVSVEAYSKPNCSTIKKQVTKLFDEQYEETDLGALGEFAKRVVKAYQLGLSNPSCFSKKEVSEMRIGVRELKAGCDEARKDELAWAIQGGLCKIYKPLWKHLK